ncbi:MAG: protein translocase subunit SecF [Candidatus Krumholzibacteria bacterium]|nr:protein translocase subunit SecF [Candidatus Krumholzibacteria bacterium]
MQFFKTPNIEFVGRGRRAMLLSALLILTGLVSVAVHRGLRLSIDFAGGALVEIKLDQPTPIGDVRSAVTAAGFGGAEVTRYGPPTEYLIKVKAVGNAAEVAEHLKDALSAGLAGSSVEIRRIESVGPKIGAELRTAAFWAVMYSLLGIVIYVSWRFQFRMAIAAIVALVHDVLITLGFFSVVDMEISLAVIAALLTIVGYSLNDTIVVFDRVREDLHTRRRENFDRIVNGALNETLSRTLITSGTTLLVVTSLAILGGEVIRDFALALLVGIFVGTYSSLFIATPVVVEWHRRRAGKDRR